MARGVGGGGLFDGGDYFKNDDQRGAIIWARWLFKVERLFEGGD